MGHLFFDEYIFFSADIEVALVENDYVILK